MNCLNAFKGGSWSGENRFKHIFNLAFFGDSISLHLALLHSGWRWEKDTRHIFVFAAAIWRSSCFFSNNKMFTKRSRLNVVEQDTRRGLWMDVCGDTILMKMLGSAPGRAYGFRFCHARHDVEWLLAWLFFRHRFSPSMDDRGNLFNWCLERMKAQTVPHARAKRLGVKCLWRNFLCGSNDCFSFTSIVTLMHSSINTHL